MSTPPGSPNPVTEGTPPNTPGDLTYFGDKDENLSAWAEGKLLDEMDPRATKRAQKTKPGTPSDDKHNLVSPGDDDRPNNIITQHDGQNVNLRSAFDKAGDERESLLEQPQEENVSKIKKFFRKWTPPCFKRDRARLKNKKHKKKTKYTKKRKPTKKRKHTRKKT